MSSTVILTYLCSSNHSPLVNFTLFLTAEQRRRSHQRLEGENGEIFHLRLRRGIILHEGDILGGDEGDIFVKIEAKKEELITVTAKDNLSLMKAIYHLANRHIPLEIKENYVRLTYDSVIEKMLIQLGVNISKDIEVFYPETGAYHHH